MTREERILEFLRKNKEEVNASKERFKQHSREFDEKIAKMLAVL